MVDTAVLKDIADSVGFFQRLFQITVALALGESFKQFVADESKSSSGEDHVFCDRFPALITFISIIIPFFDGMNRYFYFVYIKSGAELPKDYAYHLLFDSACFLAESAIFFIMSRALRVERVTSYTVYILVLMIVDLCWAYFSLLGSGSRFWFMLLDAIVLAVMIATRAVLHWKSEYIHKLIASILIAIANVGVLIVGYAVSWDYYFPAI